jgi:hypothetical protein
MRRIAFTALVGIIALNGFLGYYGQYFADQMRHTLKYYGATVPALTVMALALPPGFYLLGFLALLVLGLSIGRVLTDAKMILAALGCLVLDIATLFVLLWGVIHVAIRMR